MEKGFSNLLRSSRLSSLPKAVKSHIRNNAVPKEQVVHTTPASFYRRDFGLKRAMPERMKTPYVTVKALDTLEGMTDFNFGSSYHLKVKRFQETGAAITPLPTSGLFNASVENKTWSNMTPEELKDLVRSSKGKRRDFISWALKNETKQLHQMLEKDDGVRAVQRFLEIQSTEGPNWSNEKIPVKGNAGLGYLLPGGIHNTPTGITQSTPVKGRLVPSYPQQRRAAIGGFIAQTSSSFAHKPPKMSEVPRNFLITNVRVRPNGSIDMTTNEEQLYKPSNSISENLNNKSSTSSTMLPNSISFKG